MKIHLDKKVTKKFNDLEIAILIIKDLNNFGKNSKLKNIIKIMTNFVKKTYTVTPIKVYPNIISWNEAYNKEKPPKYHTSVEALIDSILNKKEFPYNNKLVDIYNFVSLKHMIPIGGSDLDKIEKDISVRLATGKETIKPPKKKTENCKIGELIYKDSKKVLARRFQYSENQESVITEETTNAIIFMDFLPPMDKSEFQKQIQELRELIEVVVQPKSIELHIINESTPDIEFKKTK